MPDEDETANMVFLESSLPSHGIMDISEEVPVQEVYLTVDQSGSVPLTYKMAMGSLQCVERKVRTELRALSDFCTMRLEISHFGRRALTTK
jgi:hypothetical protein